MTVLSFARVYVVASLFVGAALSQSEDPLKSLAQVGDEYKDYSARTVSLPVAIPSVSLRIVSRVSCFAQIVRDRDRSRVGAEPLDDGERQRIAKLFERVVTTAVSNQMAVQDDSSWRLLVVSGEGGGFIVGSGGMITGELFLLDMRDRTLIAHSSDPLGKGETVDAATQDLAGEVARAFKQMATPAATSPRRAAPPDARNTASTLPSAIETRVTTLPSGTDEDVWVSDDGKHWCYRLKTDAGVSLAGDRPYGPTNYRVIASPQLAPATGRCAFYAQTHGGDVVLVVDNRGYPTKSSQEAFVAWSDNGEHWLAVWDEVDRTTGKVCVVLVS